MIADDVFRGRYRDGFSKADPIVLNAVTLRDWASLPLSRRISPWRKSQTFGARRRGFRFRPEDGSGFAPHKI